MFQYSGRMTRVVDGDTFDIVVDLGFHITHKIRVRLKDVDTPELYRPCNDNELQHARAAKEFVEGLISDNNYVEIETYKERGSSFGRFVADVNVCNPVGGMSSLKKLLIDRGMVKLESYELPYTAEGAK